MQKKLLKLLSFMSIFLLVACFNKVDIKPSTQAPKTRPKIALALGGGASKGFAHIGVIKILKQNNIPIDIITGTSAGAIVGSLYASGMSLDRLELESELLNKFDLADFTFSSSGFIQGRKIQDYINQKVKNKPIQNLPIRFAAIATNFDTGKMTVFNYGNTGQAVRASASVPNIFQPVQINGHKYVDGGLTAPVPVRAAKQMGADIIIAVDISARPDKQINSGFFSQLNQSLSIMSVEALQNELNQANIIIQPKVLELGATSGFDQKSQAIKAGEVAAEKVMPQLKKLLASYTKKAP